MQKITNLLVFLTALLTSLAEDFDSQNTLPFEIKARVEVVRELEKPPKNFQAIFNSRLDNAVTNRFNSFRYLDFLRDEKDADSMGDFGGRAFRSAGRTASREILRGYFVDDPTSSLPIVWWLSEKVDDIASGKLARFLIKTFSGDVEQDQLTSPFNRDEGLPITDRGFSSHAFNFGLRPFNMDNPYMFFGYTVRVDETEIASVQSRLYMRRWNDPAAEIIAKIPLGQWWSVGAGIRFEDGNGLNQDEEEKTNEGHWNTARTGLSSFLGVQGPIFGGWLFAGTGYPESLTILFDKSF